MAVLEQSETESAQRRKVKKALTHRDFYHHVDCAQESVAIRAGCSTGASRDHGLWTRLGVPQGLALD